MTKKRKSFFRWLARFGRRMKIHERIVDNPIYVSFVVLFLLMFLIVGWTLLKGLYNRTFGVDVLVEAHGMLLDVFVFGVIVLYLNQIGEKRRQIESYRNEIDDLRGWCSELAARKNRGNIIRLARSGVRFVDLQDSCLQSMDFGSAKIDLTGSIFLRANLENVMSHNSVLDECKFQEAMMEGADLSNCSAVSANFSYARLSNASLNSVNFTHAIFSGADLSDTEIDYAVFAQTLMDACKLSRSTAQHADFSCTDLHRSELIGCNLTGSRFNDARLESTNFESALLSDCNLSNADCTNASFRHANLRNVRFNNAILVGADLREVTHYDAAYLNAQGMEESKSIECFVEDLSKCRSLYGAKFDDAVHEAIQYGYPDLLLTPKNLEIKLSTVA